MLLNEQGDSYCKQIVTFGKGRCSRARTVGCMVQEAGAGSHNRSVCEY